MRKPLQTCAFAVATLACSPALAQNSGPALPTLEPLITVTEDEDDGPIAVADRYRPEYAQQGLPAGNFRLYPKIRIGAGYNSNVFATQTDTTSDALYTISPEVTAISQWGGGELRAYARARYLDYVSTPNAEEPTYAIGADTQIDTTIPIRFEAGANFGQYVERRDSSAFPLGRIAPVTFRRATGYGRAIYQTGLVRLTGAADVSMFGFSSAKVLDISLTEVSRLEQGFRDRVEGRVTARAELAVAPRIATYLQGGYSGIGYDNAVVSPGGQPNRDAEEFTVLGGATFSASLFRGDIGLGYVRHDYDAPIYPTIEGFAAEARVIYYATPILTLTGEASRSVEESAFGAESGFFSSRTSLRADYEFRRNIILNADLSYRYNDFKGSAREDDILRLGVGGQYAANRRLAFDVNAFYLDRETSGVAFGSNYDELQIILQTTFQL